MAKRRTEWITQAELARRLGLTSRHVYRLVEEPGFPLDKSRKGRDRVPWPDANLWYIEHRIRQERSRHKPKNLDESRAAKLEAEARIAQMEAARVEGTLIFLEDHERSVSSLLEVLRSGLQAAPGTWAPHLVGAKTIAQASARLLPLVHELVESLRTEVEGLDEEDETAAA